MGGGDSSGTEWQKGKKALLLPTPSPPFLPPSYSDFFLVLRLRQHHGRPQSDGACCASPHAPASKTGASEERSAAGASWTFLPPFCCPERGGGVLQPSLPLFAGLAKAGGGGEIEEGRKEKGDFGGSESEGE